MRRMAVAGSLGLMVLAGTLAAPLAPLQASDANLAYNEWLIALGKAAAADPNYKRIPLDTPAQTKAFTDLTHQLYRKQIDADQYRAAVLAQYPGHEYEVGFIIAKLP
ncbi:hypothetical protein FJQ54_03475 [Sandaracinobacter neustonicus]|uniref:DUF885 domain-containing protein n=1 Tax=Sandaracinobacter neustonicus TaxID=1715348 RepID=A0A501XTV2_9SPHN|nr:hypothetical protein [Sandaracinobacter neustonicus]TPE63915.1 hypothetical protein FJQ54_03475 [Sandaracinobacter neustonicus]